MFNNSLFAQQLDSRYGLLKQLRDLLLNAPVLVRLDALKAGRFQAAIQARLMLAAGQIDMAKRSLDAVATALLKCGFQRVERPLLSSDGRSSNRVAVVWLDPQDHPQGGWSLGSAPRPGGVAAGPGGCSEPPQRSPETDGPTAASPSSTIGSIGSVGMLGPDWPRLLVKVPHWSLR